MISPENTGRVQKVKDRMSHPAVRSVVPVNQVHRQAEQHPSSIQCKSQKHPADGECGDIDEECRDRGNYDLNHREDALDYVSNQLEP